MSAAGTVVPGPSVVVMGDGVMDDKVTRRRMLQLAGGAGLALVAAACGGGGDSNRTSSRVGRGSSSSVSSPPSVPPTSAAGPAPVACVLTPETTEGPFYLTGEPERRDVTEGKPGTPLRLTLTVADATTCVPIPGAVVEIWHADAAGAYSGFGAGAQSRTFLRGSQVAGNDGTVIFDTIYPGGYQGRAVHIHTKARTSKSASLVHTGQMFFDDALSDEVFTAPVYSGGASRTRNPQDSIYRSGGALSTLAVVKNGAAYDGRMTIGIRTSA
jgi:protocatechuate 3,4-dioxygenase beta subunit